MVLPDGYSSDDNDCNGECDNASQQGRKYDWQVITVYCRCSRGGLKDGGLKDGGLKDGGLKYGGLKDSGSGRQAGAGGRT